MQFKKFSPKALLIVCVLPNVAFGNELHQLAEVESTQPIEYAADMSIDDLATEMAFDLLMETLESMPEEMQALPANDPRIISYLQDNPGLITPRGWLEVAKCTAALADFVITTGVPVGKIFKALKKFKSIAGSWKNVVKMWKAGNWGRLSKETVDILEKLSGIDSIAKSCIGAF